MKDLGLKSYRYSISWSRVIPDGTGEINEKGLQVRVCRCVCDLLLCAWIGVWVGGCFFFFKVH